MKLSRRALARHIGLVAGGAALAGPAAVQALVATPRQTEGHGPAAAERLEAAGVEDGPLLTAVRWHTTGHPDFDRLGRALYVADFTEPGRGHATDRLAALRRRVPTELDTVLREVVAERIGRTLAGRHPLREPTVAFWNAIVEDR